MSAGGGGGGGWGGRYRCPRTGWFLRRVIVADCSVSRSTGHLLHVVKALDRKACDIGFLDLIILLKVLYTSSGLCKSHTLSHC